MLVGEEKSRMVDDNTFGVDRSQGAGEGLQRILSQGPATGRSPITGHTRVPEFNIE